MNLLNSVEFRVFILSLLIELISAPYPKYYISNYCGLLRGSTIKLGESGVGVGVGGEGLTLGGEGGKPSVALLKLKRETYRPNLDCNVTIKAPLNYGIIAYIKKVKLRKSYPHRDLLQVTSDNTSLRWYGNNEEISPRTVIVSNPSKGEINVIFKSQNFILKLSGKGLKIVFTIFTLSDSNGKCGLNSSLSFDCTDKLCVDNILECDGINNCANSFDELNCSATSESTIGVIVFMATLAVMAILVLIFMCRTKHSRHDIVRRLSKVYTSGERRLSTMFSSDGRFPMNPEVINNTANDELNSYTSLPIIYHSIEDKPKADEHKLNNINLNSTENPQNPSQ